MGFRFRVSYVRHLHLINALINELIRQTETFLTCKRREVILTIYTRFHTAKTATAHQSSEVVKSGNRAEP